MPHFGDQEVGVSSFPRVGCRHRFCWPSDLPQFEIVPRHFRHLFAICPGKEHCKNGIGSSLFSFVSEKKRINQDKQEWPLKSATSAAREETWRPAAGDTFWQLEPKLLFRSVSFPNPSAVYLRDLGCIKALSGVGWQPFVDLSARRKAGQSTGLIAGYTFLFWVMITANVNSIIARQDFVRNLIWELYFQLL